MARYKPLNCWLEPSLASLINLCRVRRDLQSQRKVQASGKFAIIEQEEHWGHLTAGAGLPPAYNSSHIHPTTSDNHQQDKGTCKQHEEGKREPRSVHS